MGRCFLTLFLLLFFQIPSSCLFLMVKHEACKIEYEENLLIMSEFGYLRQYDNEIAKVTISCKDKKIKSEFFITYGKGEKKYKNLPVVDLQKYKSFWKYVFKHNLHKLSSIGFETMENEEEFELAYGGTPPRTESYVYFFFFKFKGKEIKFRVYDVGIANDKRYLNLLKHINSLVNIKTVITAYD